ncbi:MAG: tetratricopeptide repeat protein [Lentisphaerae bacterium]|nr:tetratricopeptide repeat protein [Lentisphaerota bacterium]
MAAKRHGNRETGARRWPAAFASLALCVAAFAQPEAAPPAPGAGEAPAAAALPDTPEALFRHAQRMETEGRMTAAVEAYARFMEQFPGHSQIQETGYRLAKCLDAVGRVDDAVKQLEAATRVRNARFRNRQDALFMLGKLYGDLGEYDKACRVIERLLGEGAGLYEEEALNLCGGYYAVQKKYNEAAGKLNILKRRVDSRFAERAAYKLVLIWLEAGNLELAVEAVGDLARQFPQNQDARGLMLRIADVFRQQRKFSQAVAICDQLTSVFPTSPEALASGYLVGLCYRDQKMPDKALEALSAAARVPGNVRRGVAAEAMVKAAEITFAEKADPEKAMALYEEAAGLARDYPDEDRRRQVLEACYFRLAEHNFQKKNWSVALEFYALLRESGTEINVLPRIMKCQAELGMDPDAYTRGERELEYVWKKIKENPGTFAAAEGEVFLADQQLGPAIEQKGPSERLLKCADVYTDILYRYPPAVLAESHLKSYICVQLGRCRAALHALELEAGAAGTNNWNAALAAFEQALTADADTPYAREALEGMARTADAAGLAEKAFDSYRRLYELTGAKLKSAPDDKTLQEDRLGYLRSMLSRADKSATMEDAIALTRRIVEQEGAGSPAARHALFYGGELHYLRKDFSAAAKAFRDFIATYGPRQNAEGDFEAGPLKVGGAPDETTRQIFDAALRVAHAWYLQGHHQNMVKAYEWMARNVPEGNPYAAEARYWLAMETVKGQAGESRENMRKLADLLWTGVVSPVPLREFPPPEAAGDGKLYHPWARDAEMMKYVKVSMVKAGEILSARNEHETAARVFAAYAILFPPPPPPRPGEPPVKDELGSIARYALGREYIALKAYDKMVAAYRPYVDGLRDDRFRFSALRFMGFHASKGDLKRYGVEAYATLLDEYGSNPRNEFDQPVPIPRGEWIRQNNASWDGMRRPPPAEFDFGQVRYALGFLYWSNGEWQQCARALAPFADDPDLAASASRPRALYMLGKSYFKRNEARRGLQALGTLVAAYPQYEAVEEAFMQAARSAMALKDWPRILELHEQFMRRFKESLYQPHMDLCWAVALLNIPERRREGFDRVSTLANSHTYEDVKADALYHQGLGALAIALPDAAGNIGKGDYRRALKMFTASLEIFPRAAACLEAARCEAALGRWASVKEYLDRLLRDFPDADADTLAAARTLLAQARREIVKSNLAGGNEPPPKAE